MPPTIAYRYALANKILRIANLGLTLKSDL